MNDFNKGNMKAGGKAFLMIAISLIAIIAFAGNLNALAVHPDLESFYGWGAGVNFLAEIYLIWNLYKRLYKKDE